jgi:hypothetical protein
MCFYINKVDSLKSAAKLLYQTAKSCQYVEKSLFFILPAVTYAVPRRIVFSMMSWTSEMSTLKDCEQVVHNL